jgi:hypothetical protein
MPRRIALNLRAGRDDNAPMTPTDPQPRICCPQPNCPHRLPLDDGIGPVGSKIWYCPNPGHPAFGPGVSVANPAAPDLYPDRTEPSHGVILGYASR